jgi:bifunctional UDP-N-acetylglucosamine pyrophosphorylase/glucosamine-1-phosphate N-acetyltransferase
MCSNLAIIILAAGKGTRMKTELPKVLCETVAGAMIDVVLRHALDLNPDSIFIVTGYKKEFVEKHVKTVFEPHLKKLHFVHQSEQLGTGHAVKVVADEASFQSIPQNSDVLILYGDTPLLEASLLKNFLISHKSQNASLSLITVNEPKENSFGRIVRDSTSNISKIVEVKDCSDLEKKIQEVNSGIYLISKNLLNDLIYKIGSNNSQNEYYLTDLVELASAAHQTIFGYIAPTFDHVMGVNNLLDLQIVNRIIMNEHLKKLIAEGVTCLDPSSVYIEPSVTVGTRSKLGSNIQIKGNTKIGSNVTIEGTALIIDSIIGDNCTLKLGSRIEGSILEESVSVGPFANIRPETVLRKDVRIGNFVETKKSILETGVKVNHLSYIGDTTIGKDTNVGAGTITCNYDGIKKSKTIIGERVFIGSNSSLVAPVTIESDTTIGAGSVITKDVSEGSLAVTRAEQKEIKGWTTKKRGAAKKG